MLKLMVDQNSVDIEATGGAEEIVSDLACGCISVLDELSNGRDDALGLLCAVLSRKLSEGMAITMNERASERGESVQQD